MTVKQLKKGEDFEKVTNQELMREIKDLKADLQKVKNEVTAKQPNSKFKVAKTTTDKNGNLITKYHNETARKIGNTIKKRGSVSRPEMSKILQKNGVDVSRPTVISIMRRYASNFERFKVYERKARIRNSTTLKHVG